MKNILIIGGCGYIGTMVTKKLKKNNKITIVDRNSYSHDIFENINIIKKNMNELDYNFIREFDVIICLGGQTSVKSANDIFLSIENNIENVTKIFKICKKEQIIIYGSSSSVYGNTNNKIVDESYTSNKYYNYYDFSKQMLDMYTEIITKSKKRIIFGLRFGTVNGYSPNFRNDIMINAMTNNAILKNEVKIYSKETRRAILGISDLCNAIEKIIEYGNITNSGIYNLASFNSTVDIVGNEVSKITNSECIDCNELKTKENIELIKNDTSSYNFSISCTKFIENFHFKFNDTVESIVNDISDNFNNIIINKSRGNKTTKQLEYYYSYKKIKKCRVCDSKDLESILDLGRQPLANELHKNKLNSKIYPLNLLLCKNCYHLQLEHIVNPKILYKNYIYESGTSNTILEYFSKLYNKINKLVNKESKKIIEIASNDGSQLDIFKKGGWVTIGIDPAENLAEISGKNHDIYCDFLNEKITRK